MNLRECFEDVLSLAANNMLDPSQIAEDPDVLTPMADRQDEALNRVGKALGEIDELCQMGLNSAEPKHWEAALQDILAFVRS